MLTLKLIGISIFVIIFASACDALQEEGLPTDEARAALEIQVREICQHAEPDEVKKQVERIRNARGVKLGDAWVYREAGAATGPDIRVFKSGLLFGPLLDDVFEQCQDSRQKRIDANHEKMDIINASLQTVDASLQTVNASLGQVNDMIGTSNGNLETIDESLQSRLQQVNQSLQTVNGSLQRVNTSIQANAPSSSSSP